MRKIIDCHCHIYPEKIAAKAVESIGRFYDIEMDNNGTLEGYGSVTSESKFNNIIEKFRNFFETIGLYIKMFFEVIAKAG